MESRPGEERLSPLFQEAMSGVSMYDYGDWNEEPPLQAGHSQQAPAKARSVGLTRSSSSRESYYSDVSRASMISSYPLSAEDSDLCPTFRDSLFLPVQRSKSAKH